jgi:hypothetical protein
MVMILSDGVLDVGTRLAAPNETYLEDVNTAVAQCVCPDEHPNLGRQREDTRHRHVVRLLRKYQPGLLLRKCI